MPDVYCFKLTEDKKAYVCKSLKCRKRSKTRPSKGDSHKHLRKHFRPVLCPYPGCENKQPWQRDMERHIYTNHPMMAKALGISIRPGWCDICDQSFTRHDNYLKHVGRRHPELKKKR